MKSKLLDKDKVIKALHLAHTSIWYSAMYHNANEDPISESIRVMVHEQTKRLIGEALQSFVMNLTNELEQCEPDEFPCALCYEEDKSNE